MTPIAIAVILAAILLSPAGAAESARWVEPDQYLPKHPEMKVVFLDIGQGDGAFILTPNNRTALIDAGGQPAWTGLDYHPGREKVVPFLRDLGVNKIDFAVISHPHADHVEGFIDVFKSLKVGTLVDPGLEHDEPEYPQVLALAQKQKTEYLVVGEGDTLNWDPLLRVEIFSPPRDFSFDDLNDNSIILKITYRNMTFLFPGDAEEGAEMRVVKRHKEEIGAVVLKVCHHGSKTSSTPRFIDAVHPETAVISCGRGNLFKHPHPPTLSRLHSRGVRVFRTDEDGDVTLRTDGDTYTVTTERHP